MNTGINLIVANVGVSFEIIVTLIAFLAGLIFYATDFRLGTMLHFFAFVCIFIWFYLVNLNYTVPLILMCLFLIIMSFSFYATAKATYNQSVI